MNFNHKTRGLVGKWKEKERIFVWTERIFFLFFEFYSAFYQKEEIFSRIDMESFRILASEEYQDNEKFFIDFFRLV